ncbi:hypothetical protein, partial [Mycobacterium malmoense]|uniref:hypothetical protein n=1 Tax=Mycobacterium malmoense TaxID=1780 RepID=UPI001FC94A22
APGPPPPPPPPSGGETRAIPVPGTRSDDAGDPAEPTTAFPSMRSEQDDSDAATEKLNSRAQADNGDARQRRRSAGGLSAQDLLRREGRL